MATALQNVINPSYQQTGRGYEATQIKAKELKFLEIGVRDVTIKHPDNSFHQYNVKIGLTRRGTQSARIICQFFNKPVNEYTPTLEIFSDRYKALLKSLDQKATDAINNNKRLRTNLIKHLQKTEVPHKAKVEIFRPKANSQPAPTFSTNDYGSMADNSSLSSDGSDDEEPTSILCPPPTNPVKKVTWGAVGRVLKKGAYYCGMTFLAIAFPPCFLAYIAYQRGKNSS